MIQCTPEQIAEIAEQLSMNFVVYIHKDTGEIISFPDPRHYMDFEEDPWEPVYSNVQNNPDDYHEVEQWTSGDAFEVMARFAEQVRDAGLKKRLLYALDQKKPFRRFRSIVDDAGEYRQEWFQFRDKAQQAYVLQAIETLNAIDAPDDPEDFD
jgi:hypothetical protein